MHDNDQDQTKGAFSMKKTMFTRFFLSLFYLSCVQSVMAQNQMQCCDPTNNYMPNTEMYCTTPSWNDQCCTAPCENDQSNWFFDADFLYWSTDFNAISAINAGIQTTETTADATIHIKHAKQKWDPGVRLTAGWSGCDNWDIQTSWTNFYNSTTKRTAPFMLQINEDNLGTEGRSKFSFRYNAADLELGKTLCLSPYLHIRPFIGVHAIWTQINSKLNIIAPPVNGTDLQTDGFTFGLNMKRHSWGVGPKIGINTLWGNYNGFSLVANINGSFVYGKQKANINAEVDITSAVDINIHLLGNSHWQLMSTAQIQSGLSYAGNFCNHEFRINALWECNSINQANNILIFDKSINTQGLTLSLEFQF